MADKVNFLEKEIFDDKANRSLGWLKRSIDACNGNGSAAYYSRLYKPFSGWSSAYPETTGYIIETLFDYYHQFKDESLKEYAFKSADWVCTLQMDNGALPSGLLSTNPSPSIFNTGQMIFGLVRAYEESGDDKYRIVFEKAVNWLVSVLEEDGSWASGAYKSGYIPSYYTRVVWPALYANEHMKSAEVEAAMRKAIGYYEAKIQENLSVADWSFNTGQSAFTHTIAYTIRGFLESAVLLKDDDLMAKTVQLSEKIMRLRELRSKISGWYDADWKGSDKFTCLTGNCQLSIILTRLYELTDDIRYYNSSLKIFGDVVYKQKKSGAVAGSSPVWGRYMFMRYPNWVAKFYLDAYLHLYQSYTKITSI